MEGSSPATLSRSKGVPSRKLPDTSTKRQTPLSHWILSIAEDIKKWTNPEPTPPLLLLNRARYLCSWKQYGCNRSEVKWATPTCKCITTIVMIYVTLQTSLVQWLRPFYCFIFCCCFLLGPSEWQKWLHAISGPEIRVPVREMIQIWSISCCLCTSWNSTMKFMKSNSCSYKCGHMVQVYQRDTLFNCPALESSKSLHIDVHSKSTYSCELRRNATAQGLSSFRPCFNILEPQWRLQIGPCDLWNTNPEPAKSSTDTSTFDILWPRLTV